METTHAAERRSAVQSGMSFQRLGAICAMAGSLLNWVANLLHPKELVAYDSTAHFQTIAADASWSLDHFLFVIVAALTLWGLLALADSLVQHPAGVWVRLASSLAIVGTAIMAIFFVVDGFGMKAAALVWQSAPAAEGVTALYFALLMSKLGLATGSAYQVWYLGLLPIVYAVAMLETGAYPKWLALLALLGGLLGVAAGAGFFLAGYSTFGLFAFIGAQSIVAVWIFIAGLILYRRPTA